MGKHKGVSIAQHSKMFCQKYSVELLLRALAEDMIRQRGSQEHLGMGLRQ